VIRVRCAQSLSRFIVLTKTFQGAAAALALGCFSNRIRSVQPGMAKAKEFTVAIADKPGALGNCFLDLAERGVNIVAFQSYVEERESLVRFVADNVATKAVLATKSMIFEETDVAVVKLGHRPGIAGPSSCTPRRSADQH
jgi:prephenate dehydratase